LLVILIDVGLNFLFRGMSLSVMNKLNMIIRKDFTYQVLTKIS